MIGLRVSHESSLARLKGFFYRDGTSPDPSSSRRHSSRQRNFFAIFRRAFGADPACWAPAPAGAAWWWAARAAAHHLGAPSSSSSASPQHMRSTDDEIRRSCMAVLRLLPIRSLIRPRQVEWTADGRAERVVPARCAAPPPPPPPAPSALRQTQPLASEHPPPRGVHIAVGRKSKFDVEKSKV